MNRYSFKEKGGKYIASGTVRVKSLLCDDGERTPGKVLPVPLAADLGLPRLGNVVRHAESKVSIMLDGHELNGNVGTAHAHLQETTPTCIAAVDGEASGGLQALD